MSTKIKQKSTTKQASLENSIMNAINSGKVVLKPRWFFVAGSVAAVAGLISLSIVIIFLLSLLLFSLRQHGPMGAVRLELMLASFPWWLLSMAVAGIIGGILLLRQYDFSYKKNMWLVGAAFVGALIAAAALINVTGLDEIWFKRGPMRQFYQRFETVEVPRGKWAKLRAIQ